MTTPKISSGTSQKSSLCPVCGDPKSVRAKTCSNKCRQKLFRQQKKATEETPSTNLSSTGPEPAPLPQPTSQKDYVQLLARVRTAGPHVLAKSVPREQLQAAHRVLVEAINLTKTEAKPGSVAAPKAGRCACKPPKPKATQGAAGLMKCSGCGNLR